MGPDASTEIRIGGDYSKVGGERSGRARGGKGECLGRLVPLGAVAGATGAADKARVPEEAAVPVTVLVFCARLAARVQGRVRRRRRRRGHAGTEAKRAGLEVALTALEVAARGAVRVARAGLVARVGRRRLRRLARVAPSNERSILNSPYELCFV